MEPQEILRATAILEQLLKYTKQLAAFENDPGVDVVALSQACTRRIEDLKTIMPDRLEDCPDAGLVKMVEDLHSQTRHCTEMLERKLESTGYQLEGFSKRKKAISAYRG